MDEAPDQTNGDDDEGDSIALGKRLVRAEGGGASLGDRLIARFYRLIWQTPLHSLKLKGRHPLKLVGVPDDPVAGDAARGEAILAGDFGHLGEPLTVENFGIGQFSASLVASERVHSFAWLRDLAALNRARAAPAAESATASWLAAHGDVVAEPAWRPDIAARRMMSWAAHAPLILSSTDLVYRSSVLNHVARAGRHLDRTADRTAPGARRIIAWCGVTAAGILIPGNEPRRIFGEKGLARALETGLSSDGGSLCRAPDAQADLVEALVMLRAIYAMRKLATPKALEHAISSAASVLAGVILGDHALSSWQGSVPRSDIAALLEAVGGSARPLRQAREWGYQRLSCAGTTIICDTAPPPLSHVSLNGCASTLAFELCDRDKRIVVNCGGARAGGLSGMPELAEGLRTTAAHSTLTLADSNSTAIHKGGQIGKGVHETALDRQEQENASRIEASHDGYLRRFGFTHQRSITMTSDGSEVRGEDTLLPGVKRLKTETGFAVRFHLAPAIAVSPTADGLGAVMKGDDGLLWQFRARGGVLAIEDSLWIGHDGRPQGTQQLVISGEADPGGATIGWVFKRAG